MCEHELLGLCFTRAPSEAGFAIFGFSEFLAALALLVLVYNSTDPLYRFRIAVAPLPLYHLTFVSTAIIGAGTLLTDLWFAERWYAPAWGVSRATLQGIFGSAFLVTVLLWIWFAFIRPSKYGRWNHPLYFRAFYRAMVKGSEADLPTLASELLRSVRPLVSFAALLPKESEKERSEVAVNAHNLLLMIGNRKFCRHVVASSPVTAMALVEEAIFQGKYSLPLGQFLRNLTVESIFNVDSILYHEDSGYSSGLVGYVQPFSKTIYGNFKFVESLSHSGISPLDIDYPFPDKMNGVQFEAYCRITRITLMDFVESGRYVNHSYALYRAFDIIKDAGKSLYKLNGAPQGVSISDATDRVSAAVGFLSETMRFLGLRKDLEFGQLRASRDGEPFGTPSLFDNLAEIMFEIVLDSAHVKSPAETAWAVQYVTIWGRLFSHHEKNVAWKTVGFKFRRLIYDEIKKMNEMPNFKSAKILGLCLNIFGLSQPKTKGRYRDMFPLAKAVFSWTKRHFLEVDEALPRVADACAIGGITFDREAGSLTKTYAQGLRNEPSIEVLVLNKPTSKKR
mgnify:CR=1 FL=1